jgi:UDP-glucose 4-epimerase
MSADLLGVRAVVTGGAGFVGSTIVDRLLDAGADEVFVIDNLVRGSVEHLDGAQRSGRVRFVEGDIRDRDLLRAAFDGADVVFHQAALRITQCAEQPREAIGAMVDATYEVFEAAVARGVPRVVYASSASVYGTAEEYPTPEHHHPYDNRTLYGAAKLFTEGLAASFHDMYGLDSVGLRYFNVYGPRMDVHGAYTEVLVRWMERIAVGTPPLIFGDGSQTMDFVVVDDVARANLLAATAPIGADGLDGHRVFNVGSGVETSLVELATTLLEVMGRPDLAPEFGPERSVNPVRRRLADTAAADRDLGFRARIGLRDGLDRLVRWWTDRRATIAGGARP